MIAPPSKNDLCPCASGAEFGSCCCLDARETPKEIVILHNEVLAKKCDYMVDYFDSQPRTWVTVNQTTKDGRTTERVVDSNRVTQDVKKGKLEKNINNLVQKYFAQLIEQYISGTLAWFEVPTVLHYSRGGKYATHADSENFDPVSAKWKKLADRDYSILIYLSEDFSGGNILFNKFGFSYSPKKGDVIFFPSDHRYLHTVEPIEAGNRYTIVSWCAIKESEKIGTEPPDRSIIV